MGKLKRVAALSIVCLISGCAFRVAGQVQEGRRALLVKDPEAALTHFQEAARTDPDYTGPGPLREGVWTYIGRAQYDAGRLPEARQSLERARSSYKDDYFASLYLGLALARSGERSRGLDEIHSGMRGLHDWLEYVTRYAQYGLFWDPGREIRSGIEKELAVISGGEPDWPRLIASAEWLGRKMEEEMDRARRDENRYYRERFPDRRPRVFIGIGF